MEHAIYWISGQLKPVVLLLIMSIGIRILLQALGQRWITTTAHTATLVLLPLLTYIITKVITGNIALSLGMIGALSIVRFRNPVRSPLELSVYFCAITMGIAASVNIKWLVLLGVSVGLATIALLLIHFLWLHMFEKPFFTASFSEGNTLSTLEITTSEEILQLDNSEYLTLKRATQEGNQYMMTSQSFSSLLSIQKALKNDPKILGYQLNK